MFLDVNTVAFNVGQTWGAALTLVLSLPPLTPPPRRRGPRWVFCCWFIANSVHFCFLVVHFVVFGFSEKHISPHRGVMLSESGMHAFQLGELCFPSRGVMLSNVGSYAFRVGDACFPREPLRPPHLGRG